MSQDHIHINYVHSVSILNLVFATLHILIFYLKNLVRVGSKKVAASKMNRATFTFGENEVCLSGKHCFSHES